MNGNLTLLGLEYCTTRSYNIPYIDHLLEECIGLVSNLIPADIDLNLPLFILHMAEGSLAHHTLTHQASCQRYFLPFHLLKVLNHLSAMRANLILCHLIGILTIPL